ncbi:hypothetical protein JL722_7576 [Aureococcus anophagefferens]|nr:hypothetical protein JL722_7576 [Aureococcus anophagefferens]
MDPELIKKKREYEARKTRTKLALNLCTICGADKAKACEGCGTTAYCSTACQRIDWRDRGHREACKKIQAAAAARAEAPTPPPSPPRDVFYGPAPRSHADEVRARIAAEHEAARARREANPEREPLSARHGYWFERAAAKGDETATRNLAILDAHEHKTEIKRPDDTIGDASV